VSDDAAVLADPFSVSLHAIRRAPPTPGGTAVVYGCGTLGLLSVALLRAAHPDVRVLAVARFEHQARLAETFGAERVVAHRPTRRVIDAVGDVTGAEAVEPWRGLPMLNGGADVVYDTVSSAETFEVGLRVVGSNGFGIEEIDGRRQHAMEWYFEFVRSQRIDVTPIITHRFPLEAYRDAFMTCYAQGDHSAVKVLFDAFPAAAA
jgi:threonine dehydrogenase-like Zn-dependent dehydrogenase